jgi:hypothetical protein
MRLPSALALRPLPACLWPRQARSAQAIQPHLNKCFDGIRRLEFGKELGSIDILAMVSGGLCC